MSPYSLKAIVFVLRMYITRSTTKEANTSTHTLHASEPRTATNTFFGEWQRSYRKAPRLCRSRSRYSCGASGIGYRALLGIHTYIHTYIQTDRQTDRQTDIHTYIHAYMHACMHAYIHTYIYIYIIFIYLFSFLIFLYIEGGFRA